MIRRISTKWVLAVLAVVVLPFLGFAYYVDSFVSQRFADDVVRYHLLGHAAELAERLDRIVDERRQDAQVLVAVPAVAYALTEVDAEHPVFRDGVESLFNRLVAQIGASDFVIALDREGSVVVTNVLDSVGQPIDPWTLGAIRDYPWAEQPWFAEALRTGAAALDVDQFGVIHEDAVAKVEEGYHFGFVQRVLGRFEALGPLETVGLIVTLVPWSTVQEEVSNYGVRRQRDTLSDVASENMYDSTYAWVWASDADTILAHPNRKLYGERVSEDPINLPDLVKAANETQWGMYPDYTFKDMRTGEDIRKKAAFRHGRSSLDGGFGWVVGVGVDYPDIYGPIHEITSTIAKASALVLLLAVVVTVVVARRTTRPVQDLEAFTRRVASGDLDAQVPVRGHDELADLARSFNRMTVQLKENRAQLVEAEKDAAWREMARQVAHEIKNPLTPIQLSVSLLKRAYDEDSPEFPMIFERTIDVVQRQVRNMRDIAQDFYRFAGEHRDPQPVDARDVLNDVFELNAAWAESEGVQLEWRTDSDSAAHGEAPSYIVEADPDELQRALVNLVSNAIEATGENGGQIIGDVERVGEIVRITIRDSGKGIDDEVLARLFEPYFTTRSSGTGLGLAIVRRIVEDLGGAVTLENVDGGGAVATIELPHHVAA